MTSRKKEDYGFKKSSGVDYGQVVDRQMGDDRFERQRAIRAASAAPPAEKPKSTGAKVAAPQSATMDAFMRMVTGKEERTIADRISDPNRPTWEQYKKENADKLDLNGNTDKEMKAYRKQLDAARDKALARGGSGGSKKKKKKRKKRSRSASDEDDSDSSSEDDRRRSKKRHHRKKRKSHKRRRKSSDSESDSSNDDSDSGREGDRDRDRDRDRSRRRKHAKKSKKTSCSKHRRSASLSPVRLSSFLQQENERSGGESS